MAVKLGNNAIGRLASNITSTDTSITLQAGNGTSFPALATGEWFPATIYRADTTLEIVRVTARAADVLTVVRGQEGTSPKAFSLGDRIELRLTAGALMQLLAEVSASGVMFTPTGGLVATNVQAALQELNTNKQAAGSYALASHTHAWGEITGKPATFAPTIGTTATTAKAGNYVPAWDEITGKPATFAPTIGTTATTAKAGNYVPTWAEVTGKPTTFAPATHTHAWSQVTGAPVYTTRWPTWAEVSGKPATFPPSQPSAAQIGAGTAGLGLWAIGSYAIAMWMGSGGGLSVGGTYPNTSFAISGRPPAGNYLIMGIASYAAGSGDGGMGSTNTIRYLVLRVS